MSERKKKLVHLLIPKEFKVWCRQNASPTNLVFTALPSKCTCANCLTAMRGKTTGNYKPFRVKHVGPQRQLRDEITPSPRERTDDMTPLEQLQDSVKAAMNKLRASAKPPTESGEVPIMDETEAVRLVTADSGRVYQVPAEIAELIKATRTRLKEVEKERDDYRFEFNEMVESQRRTKQELETLKAENERLRKALKWAPEFKPHACSASDIGGDE